MSKHAMCVLVLSLMDRNGHHGKLIPTKQKQGATPFFKALFGLGVPPAAARLGEGHDADVKECIIVCGRALLSLDLDGR